MDDWRRPRRDYSRRKPPRGNCHPSVPAWEKDFCRVVGALNWGTLMQMKQFMHLYKNVIEWDDSAAEEAFNSAKRRYWAGINGLPYDSPLPDPDLYIDNIDWDLEDGINTEKLTDIDSLSLIPSTKERHEPVIIFDDSLVRNQALPSGWGDDDHDVKVKIRNQADAPTRLGDDDVKVETITPTGWDDDVVKEETRNQLIVPTGWGDDEEKVEFSSQKIIPTGWSNDEEVRMENQKIVPTGWGNEDAEKLEIATWSIIPTGWDDDEEPGKATDNNPQANFIPGGSLAHITPTGWGDDENQQIKPTGWVDDSKQPIMSTGWVDGDNQQVAPTGWGNAYDNIAATGWPGYCNYAWPGYYNNAWQFGCGSQHLGHKPCGGNWNWNEPWGQSYSTNVGPGWGPGHWNDAPFLMGSGIRVHYRTPSPRFPGKEHYNSRDQKKNDRGRYGGNQSGTGSSSGGRNAGRRWNSGNSCGAARTGGGQSWKWVKRVS